MSAPGRPQALMPEPLGGEGNPLSAPGRPQAPMPEPLAGEGTPVRAAAHPGFARYLAPVRLEEALEAMARPGGATVLAGGTDLMLQLGIGRVRPAATLLNIRHVEGLEAIGDEGGELVVGTLVPVSTLLADPRVALHAPLLVLAARRFASEQIRNAATVGGNVCNASPAGDLATPLLALGAAVTLARLDGGKVRTRRLPVDGFFTGPGRTQRAADELLLALHSASTRAARARAWTSRRSRSRWPRGGATAAPCTRCAWRWAPWRRRRCARPAPNGCSRGSCPAPSAAPRPPAPRPTMRGRSTTCAPAPGTGASCCAT